MEITAIALEGLERAQEAFGKAAGRLASASAAAAENAGADVVDLSAETVALLAARRQFEANVAVLRTAQSMIPPAPKD